MTTDGGAFNLLDEPWVRVRTHTGEVLDLSLRQVFERAHHLNGLAGEVPTQDVAVLRVLEAVLLGATRSDHLRSDDESIDLWDAWWRSGKFPTDVVWGYLERHHERFYLLHQSEPFMQVADLHTASGNASGLIKLIADVPDGHQYFTTRAGREIESLSLAEAARWLVHCHAFDPAGIKTGAVGDDRVKGGKGYSMGYPAWVGNLGVIVVNGANLFETLLLNLPLSLGTNPDDRPVWERPALPSGVCADHLAPTGPADLFTWPSRRVRLLERNGLIVDVQISNGDRLGPQNQSGNEPMSSWRKSQNQSKRGEGDVYMPVLHVPEKRIWQGLGSLLITARGVTHRAPVLDWLATLIESGCLPAGFRVRLRTVGLEYGAQASSIAGAVDDGLDARAAALTEPILAQCAVDAAARAGSAVVALANLASNLEQAAGGDSERPRSRTFEFGYSLLDGPYRRWLSDLVDVATIAERLDDWSQQVRRILLDAGQSLITAAGPAAVVGRPVSRMGSDEKQRIDSGLAEIWFRAALNKALGIAPVPQRQEVAS
ncbi:type I-E CRISPR-associated protein Cse1/CasA [Micropruina sp.]|uniref:type I-E CRISPR-associated protein Cse1/CasA n=1 Tax=Micropruina sp. TaxID=2737536 RepID=UPI0039E35E55